MVNCGIWLATATPMSALAECSCASGGAHVGPLLDELRRQAHRQLLRQLKLGELEALAAILVRRAADQAHQLVALLGELLLQRRQGGEGLGQRRFLRQHVGARGAAQVELAAHHRRASSRGCG